MEIPQALVDAKTALELAARRLANDRDVIENTLIQVNRAVAELHRMGAVAGGRLGTGEAPPVQRSNVIQQKPYQPPPLTQAAAEAHGPGRRVP